ncbi:anti-sigma factor [Pusillimonas caeni]|uniref:cupin domain-containing protein n=1 Tax=Pusillimonas caeni TaxID=1348472 RepID=UPI000E59F47C|nr:cupin domain-containing protein [Pusillimonas caeni]TFL13045.1 anti-sigma factor [Pusillimonas caeni]
MLVNADFSRRALVEARQYQWMQSPQSGVERVMLDRVGEEKARATSIVRYAPGSHFPSHRHPGGEEILVLSGVFSDGEGHCPAGWYLRNPPGSSHQPFSEEGATIFVKLWQMPQGDRRRVRIDTRDQRNWVARAEGASCELFDGPAEHVSLQRLAAGAAVFSGPVEGAEILVLEGCLLENGRQYDSGDWIRLPPGRYADFKAGGAGSVIYLKTGHLNNSTIIGGASA